MLRILQKKSLYLSSCYRIPGIFNSFGSRNENMLSVVRSKFDKWVNFCLFFWKTSHWLLENRYTHTKEIDLFARQTRPRDSRCGVHDQTPVGIREIVVGIGIRRRYGVTDEAYGIRTTRIVVVQCHWLPQSWTHMRTFQITIAKRLNQHGFGQIRHRQIALIAPNLMTLVLSHDSLTCSGKFECFQRCVHFPGRGWEGRSGRGSARVACSTRRCEAGLV